MASKISPERPDKPTEVKVDKAKIMGVSRDWPFPADRDGWYLARKALKGGMSDIKRATEALNTEVASGRPLSEWQVYNLQRYWEHFEEFAHQYHRNEAKMLLPWLNSKVQLPSKLTEDHKNLLKMLEQCGRQVKAIFCSSSARDELKLLRDFLLLFLDLKKQMDTQLSEVDTLALPLQRAYFNHSEQKPVEQKFFGQLSKDGKSFLICRLELPDVEELLTRLDVSWIMRSTMILPARNSYLRTGKGSLLPAIISDTGSNKPKTTLLAKAIGA